MSSLHHLWSVWPWRQRAFTKSHLAKSEPVFMYCSSLPLSSVCVVWCVGVGSTRAVSVTTNLPPSVAGGSVWTAPHVSAASLPHPARYAGSKTAAARLLISSVLIVHDDSSLLFPSACLSHLLMVTDFRHTVER